MPYEPHELVGAARILQEERELLVARAARAREVVELALHAGVEKHHLDAVVAVRRARERDEQRPRRLEIEVVRGCERARIPGGHALVIEADVDVEPRLVRAMLRDAPAVLRR